MKMFVRQLATMTALAGASFALTAGTAQAQTNHYVQVGTAFLTRLNSEFIKAQAPAGFSAPLYANTLVTATKAKTDNAFLWSQDNMIRALYWASRINSSTYQPLLDRAIDQTDWYKNPNCGTGYGYRNGQACYFDDNALLGGTLMEAYLHVSLSPKYSNHARAAMNYVLNNTDAQGGVPQKPADKGQGRYYSGPVLRTAVADTNHGKRFNNADEIAIGQQYYNQVTDPNVELVLSTGLYRNTTRYVGPGDVWEGTNTGALASSSSQVGSLAVALHEAKNAPTLAYAENLGDLIAAKWINSNGSGHVGLGGYEVVELFCELYTATGDAKWYNRAKGIVDYLIDHARDQSGYFPDGGDDNDPLGGGDESNGNWDVDRTNTAAPDHVSLLHQAAAVAAILEFAYLDTHK